VDRLFNNEESEEPLELTNILGPSLDGKWQLEEEFLQTQVS